MAELIDQSRVAVLGSSDDVLRHLSAIVEDAGFEVVSAHVDEIGRDVPAMQEFLRRHAPGIVIFDVSPPYAENWGLLQSVKRAGERTGVSVQFIVTTPNKHALEEHVGVTQAIELVGGEAERGEIAGAIARAAGARDLCC